MKRSCFKGCFCSKEVVVGQALPDNAPAKGHLAAFTLIELLVVVLIIGILAAVALPQYQRAVAKSRMATLKSLVQAVSNAAEVYYLANNTYPYSVDELDVTIPTPDEIIDDESGTIRYSYPWGQCVWQYIPGSQALFQCTHTLAGLTYLQRLQYSASAPGKRTCMAWNTTAESICAQETGSPSPYYTNTTEGYKSYMYQ